MPAYGKAADLEAEAREINAEDWQPLPGMTKAQCLECRYWFATRPRGVRIARLCWSAGRRSDSRAPVTMLEIH